MTAIGGDLTPFVRRLPSSTPAERVMAIIAGLVPILWGTGAGSEIMQRMAVPMIGGIISSSVLTLIVIPAVYAAVRGAGLPDAADNAERTWIAHR